MEDPWADGADNEDTRQTHDQRLEMEEGYTFCDSTRETEAELQANMLREVRSQCWGTAVLLLIYWMPGCVIEKLNA